jgi:ribosomal protein L29
MKAKDRKELFEKTQDELKSLLKVTRNELFKLKIDLSQGKLKNNKEVFMARKKIARILTAVKEKSFSKQIQEAVK